MKKNTVLFPMSLDLTISGLYNYIFKDLSHLQNFYWNCTQMQAEEIYDIFSDDGINIDDLLNYPEKYNIGLADTSRWVKKTNGDELVGDLQYENNLAGDE